MLDEKIIALQKALEQNDLDVYYMNSSDYHMSEYVPAYFRTIAYFSGFTGSVATLIVDKEKAYIFVDGRYHIQADKQCLVNGIEVIKLGTVGALDPLEFIIKNYSDKIIGLDGKRTSIYFANKLLQKGLTIKSIDIYSDLIVDRVPLVDTELFKLADKFTGETRKAKLEKVKYCLGGKTHVITNLESIAYLLNLRGNDIAYTPVFLSYLVFYQNEVYLFIDLERLTSDTLEELYEDGVAIKPYNEYYNFLEGIENQVVLLDEHKVNYESMIRLSKHRNKVLHMTSIVEDLKAIKNPIEIDNAIQANIYDGVSMLRFLKWIDEADKEELNEYSVLEKLNSFRLDYKAFDLSFNPIVAYNQNAAMMHYAPTLQDNARLKNEGILLIDSGGQYGEGTTDITRTIALGEVSDEVKKHFTIVLKSMFNLSSAKFLEGTTGQKIDILARKDIWELGIDYRCGTGHGVGQTLSVHEGPPNIRYANTETKSETVPFKPGHIVTDEPGIYLEGKYGIRCENMLLVVKDELNDYGQFLRFKTLTMCPFDLRLVDKKYLDQRTIDLLNDYHKEVYNTLAPYLSEDEKSYLKEVTREI